MVRRVALTCEPTREPMSSLPAPPPAPAPPPLGGDAAARYEDRFLVGQGGMGEVRLVYDRRLRRTAVMKVVRRELAGTAAARRLSVEAEITARLQHPGVVPVYDAGALADGRPYYVMREVHGRTLAEAIAAVHRASEPGAWRPDPEGFTFRRLVDAFHRVCETVAYAHDLRVVHRDLKPANVMLEAFGSVVVLDWGIAKRVRADVEGAAGVAYARVPFEPRPREGEPYPADPRGPGGPDDAESLDAAEGAVGPESRDLGTMVLDPDEQGFSGGTPDIVSADELVGRASMGSASPDPAIPGAPRTGPDLDTRAPAVTRAGAVLGTPGYMAPEQMAGAPVGPAADVHALGVTLHVLLHGRRPAPDAPPADPRVPDALVRLCRRAMAARPEVRPTATAMAVEVAAWLDGVRRRDEAMELVTRADAMRSEIASLRLRAASLHEAARTVLEPLAPHAPADEKVRGWRLEDEAERLLAEAVGREEMWAQLLHGARELVTELPEAQSRLADYYRERHAAAEAARDRAAATRAEVRLRAYDLGRHRAWLAGEGSLTLDTAPSGAEVTLYRYVLHDRRLIPEHVGPLGRTPLVGVPVPWGSLLLRVAGPAGDVDVPIMVGRAEAWAMVPPSGAGPSPLWLPRPGDLASDDCYVPPGWFPAGGDPGATDPLPAARWWADGFVMRRFPVTNGEYLAYLDDLVRQGREEEALARVPRRGDGAEADGGASLFQRRSDGTFALGADAGVEHGEPVVFVTGHDARAYATWLAARTGHAWRLPHELEREKAARGPDGRFLPWGDFLEPTWTNTLDGPIRPPRRAPNDRFPIDTSPYGVRGLAGNVRDWCGNAWRREGIRPTDGRFDPAPPWDAADGYLSLRGGAFSSSRSLCHPATRYGAPPDRRFSVCGFRLVRSYGSVESGSVTEHTLVSCPG